MTRLGIPKLVYSSSHEEDHVTDRLSHGPSTKRSKDHETSGFFVDAHCVLGPAKRIWSPFVFGHWTVHHRSVVLLSNHQDEARSAIPIQPDQLPKAGLFLRSRDAADCFLPERCPVFPSLEGLNSWQEMAAGHEKAQVFATTETTTKVKDPRLVMRFSWNKVPHRLIVHVIPLSLWHACLFCLLHLFGSKLKATRGRGLTKLSNNTCDANNITPFGMVLLRKDHHVTINCRRQEIMLFFSWILVNTFFYSPLFVQEEDRHTSDFAPFYTLTFTLEFDHIRDTVYVAYHYPYTYSTLDRNLQRFQAKAVHVSEISYTSQNLTETLAGLSVPLLTITASNKHHNDKKYVFFTGRVHPSESNASFVLDGILNFLLSDHEESRYLREKFVFKIIPMLNPDGVVSGNSRCSFAGVDLNRQWPSPSRDLCPVIFHTKNLMACLTLRAGRAMHLFVDFHGHSNQKNVFFYGNSPLSDWRSTSVIPSESMTACEYGNVGDEKSKVPSSSHSLLDLDVDAKVNRTSVSSYGHKDVSECFFAVKTRCLVLFCSHFRCPWNKYPQRFHCATAVTRCKRTGSPVPAWRCGASFIVRAATRWRAHFAALTLDPSRYTKRSSDSPLNIYRGIEMPIKKGSL